MNLSTVKWAQCNALCTSGSGFVDNVMFPHNWCQWVKATYVIQKHTHDLILNLAPESSKQHVLHSKLWCKFINVKLMHRRQTALQAVETRLQTLAFPVITWAWLKFRNHPVSRTYEVLLSCLLLSSAIASFMDYHLLLSLPHASKVLFLSLYTHLTLPTILRV